MRFVSRYCNVYHPTHFCSLFIVYMSSIIIWCVSEKRSNVAGGKIETNIPKEHSIELNFLWRWKCWLHLASSRTINEHNKRNFSYAGEVFFEMKEHKWELIYFQQNEIHCDSINKPRPRHDCWMVRYLEKSSHLIHCTFYNSFNWI